MVFFFFQAEDGIRDRNVTGVQTCALPIFLGTTVGVGGALAVVAVALGVGSFLATAVGTRLHIHRPALLQAGSLLLVALLGILALVELNLATDRKSVGEGKSVGDGGVRHGE